MDGMGHGDKYRKRSNISINCIFFFVPDSVRITRTSMMNISWLSEWSPTFASEFEVQGTADKHVWLFYVATRIILYICCRLCTQQIFLMNP